MANVTYEKGDFILTKEGKGLILEKRDATGRYKALVIKGEGGRAGYEVFFKQLTDQDLNLMRSEEKKGLSFEIKFALDCVRLSMADIGSALRTGICGGSI
jgi:hypothetical protein